MNISHPALSHKPGSWGTSGELVLNAVKLQSCNCNMDVGGHKNQQQVGLVSCYLVFPSVLGQKWTFNDFKRLSIVSEILVRSNHLV